MMLFDFIKTVPQYMLPKRTLSTLAGCLASVEHPAVKDRLIRHFIHAYNVNMSEATIETPEDYACFNDFFIRTLKPECRLISDVGIVSPVDGIVSEMGAIKQGTLIQAKKHTYSVQALLADEARAKAFIDGQFATLYLSPRDYHRIHMPLNASLQSMTYVPGQLFSVQPSTVRVIPSLFARNERLVVFFETELGPMAMVLVGAVIVGAIGTRWGGEIKRSRTSQTWTYGDEHPLVLSKAAEMGYFKLGSTVIVLFAEGQRMQWDKTLVPGQRICLGQSLGSIL